MSVTIKTTVVLILLTLALTSPSTVLAGLTLESASPTTLTSAGEIINLSLYAANLENKPQYLQVAITKEGQTSNYLGFTKNNSESWVAYQSTPQDLTALFQFTPTNNSWSGQVQAKVDTSDSGFVGPGNYLVKIMRYISSPTSHQDTNSLTVNVNFLSSPTPSPTPTTTPEPTSGSQNTNKPVIEFTAPEDSLVGSIISIPIKITNLPDSSYYLKFRLGPDDSHLTKGQTYNNNWLDDNDSWSKFPSLTPNANTWQGSVNARLPDDQSAGNYKILIRLKKNTSDTTYESELKPITFLPGPSPTKTATAALKPTSSPAVSLATAKKTTPATLLTPAITNEGTVMGTSSGNINTILSKENNRPNHIMNLAIKNGKDKSFNLKDILVPGGLFLLGFSGVVFLRNRALFSH